MTVVDESTTRSAEIPQSTCAATAPDTTSTSTTTVASWIPRTMFPERNDHFSAPSIQLYTIAEPEAILLDHICHSLVPFCPDKKSLGHEKSLGHQKIDSLLLTVDASLRRAVQGGEETDRSADDDDDYVATLEELEKYTDAGELSDEAKAFASRVLDDLQKRQSGEDTDVAERLIDALRIVRESTKAFRQLLAI